MLSPSMKASEIGQRRSWSRMARWFASPVPESPRKASRASRPWPRSDGAARRAQKARTRATAAPKRRRMRPLAAGGHGHPRQLVVEMDGGGDALPEVAQVQALVLA